MVQMCCNCPGASPFIGAVVCAEFVKEIHTPQKARSLNARRYCSLWALNGAMQGVGGPACARILTSWFAPAERGSYWQAWNIAVSAG